MPPFFLPCAVRLNNARHNFVADDVHGLKPHDPNPLDPLQDLTRLFQPGDRAVRQIDLFEIARHHHARAKAEPREEHLHLRPRRILRLIEDDERILERAPTDVGERRHLDELAAHQLLIALRAKDVLQRIVEWAQIGDA